MIRIVVALAVASCGPRREAPSITPAKRAAPLVPAADLVVAFDDTLRFVAATPTGLVVTRTVTVPDRIVALAWVGAEPVVMTGAAEVGHIAPAGYEPFPPVLATRWTVPQPGSDSPHMDTPLWDLIVDAAGSAWQARCEWGVGRLKNDDIQCDAWVYARVSGPQTISRNAPTPAPERSLPDIEPSTTTRAVIVGDGGKAILRCTEAGTTIDIPAVEDRIENGRYAFEGMEDLVWLTTAPPMFRVTMAVASQRVDQIFEGCAYSPDFAEGHVVAGPDDLVAIYASTLSVRRHGRELGRLDNIDRVAFAPRQGRTIGAWRSSTSVR